jgi:hypothetical protein
MARFMRNLLQALAELIAPPAPRAPVYVYAYYRRRNGAARPPTI